VKWMEVIFAKQLLDSIQHRVILLVRTVVRV
jgi:hypothetical protein